jgi:3-hydroxyacyl-[acyl-carrier-protein] dehydratase
MKLKDNFFRVKDVCKTEKGFDFIIEFNSEHFIYKAHFPENPITPGVCIIQVIKELLTESLQRALFLKKIDSVKFLNVINPVENREVTFSITMLLKDEETCKISTVVYSGKNKFAKLSMLLLMK